MATPATPGSLAYSANSQTPYKSPILEKGATTPGVEEEAQQKTFSCFGLCTAASAREWAVSQSLLHAALLAALSITLGLNLKVVADALELEMGSKLVWLVMIPYLLINLLLTVVSGVVAVRQMRSRAPSKLVSKRIRARRFATLWTLLSACLAIINLILCVTCGFMSGELLGTLTNAIQDTPVPILTMLVVTLGFCILDVFSGVTANSLRVSLREISARTERRYLLG